MDKPRIRSTKKPETKLQNSIRKLFEDRGWLVVATHGSMFQAGLPDLYLSHRVYGQRWVEVKMPHKHSFTDAQVELFPQLAGAGVRIWVMTAANEPQYNLVKAGEPNWYRYMNTFLSRRVR